MLVILVAYSLKRSVLLVSSIILTIHKYFKLRIPVSMSLVIYTAIIETITKHLIQCCSLKSSRLTVDNITTTGQLVYLLTCTMDYLKYILEFNLLYQTFVILGFDDFSLSLCFNVVFVLFLPFILLRNNTFLVALHHGVGNVQPAATKSFDPPRQGIHRFP